LPESQSARYVLVVAFLRGVTNPPPPDWFTRVETWSHQVRDEGVFVTVPQEAQQAIVFLAPERRGLHDAAYHRARPSRHICARTQTCRRPALTGCGSMLIWMR